MSNLCLKCSTNEAIKHPSLGFMPCKDCQDKATLAEYTYEFTPDSVKESRKEFADDIIQSSRDGIISQERLDRWGEKGLKLTDEQRKSARYVWNDIKPYREGNPKII